MADQLKAAEALYQGSNDITHAVIGGFAAVLLGHNRSTQDVDVEINFAANMRDELVQLLIEQDNRFAVQHRKLLFAPTDSADKVLIETLPLGELGLPRELRIFKLESSEIPILHPAVLILTKMKRAAQLIASTRPLPRAKFHADCSDITYLLNWLAQRDATIDFVGYKSATVDRLYKAVIDLVHHWRTTDRDMVDLLASVLEPGDREKVMDG
ncbi:uncharacterized protein F4812DRAFT_458531 [Daldinia caldariorum]|uniref:uncharacterized protein n=1 Tax=Daldinia caldariorum TaxID=326644 RepID=UPI0020087324|nr:uncharacterized protein F4812DRAFT_458531 [Daldinia caldariorum]KAI1469008.1 hypothetical protein F4812DRAFT_458531 [Daldinia caldariorum]